MSEWLNEEEQYKDTLNNEEISRIKDPEDSKDRSRGGLMLKITDVKLSKNTVATGEKFTISVQIQETVDYPYDYPYDYPISYTGTAKPVKS